MAAIVKHEAQRLLVLVRDPVPTCPKCGTTRLARPACPRCGLATTRMDAFRAARDAAVPDVVHRAWQLAVVRWADARHHDDLLQLATQHGCYAWLAAQYREAARGDDPIAVAQLARVRRAAEAALAIEGIARASTTTTARPYRGLQIMLALLVIAAVSGWGYARLRAGGTGAVAAITR